MGLYKQAEIRRFSIGGLRSWISFETSGEAGCLFRRLVKLEVFLDEAGSLFRRVVKQEIFLDELYAAGQGVFLEIWEAGSIFR